MDIFCYLNCKNNSVRRRGAARQLEKIPSRHSNVQMTKVSIVLGNKETFKETNEHFIVFGQLCCLRISCARDSCLRLAHETAESAVASARFFSFVTYLLFDKSNSLEVLITSRTCNSRLVIFDNSQADAQQLT
jgi:hypothetical protein